MKQKVFYWLVPLTLLSLSGMIVFSLQQRSAKENGPTRQLPSPCPECFSVLPQAKQFTRASGKIRIFEGSFSGGNKILGYVFHSQDLVPQITGFAGPMDLLIGIDTNGTIQGISCLAHSETSSYVGSLDLYLKQFISKGPKSAFKLGEDLDGMTGATISSEAISRIVKESITLALTDLKGRQDLAVSDQTFVVPRPQGNVDQIRDKINAAGLTPQPAKYWNVHNE